MKQMYINGEWVNAQSDAARDIINPYNGQTIAQVAEGGREDARAAIQCARDAFDNGPWRDTTPNERAGQLAALADRIALHREDLALLETLDTGKTLEESRWDIDGVADVFRYYADLIKKETPEVLQPPNNDAISHIVREPIGVCSLILPWNYPLLQASWKLAPALAAGCTVVMKPSELTPMTTLHLTELAHDVGFPPGVINTITGPGNNAGAEMSENDLVDLVSFTGGSATGRTIMRAAAQSLKRVALELGGKNPHIIFADADLETAVDYALNAVFFHAGQVCSAGSRLLVEAPIIDRFTAALVERVQHIRLGNGSDEGTEMGPLISEAQRAKVAAYVTAAQQEGATLVVGGHPPEDPALRDGFFYLPTVLTGCTSDMQIVRDEVFGPVISVERFSGEDDAIRRANDTVYGLAAGFWTQDTDRMERVSRALRFGTVWVNDFNVYFPEAPWGGYKQSGIGRELGPQGLDEYTEVKHVYRNNAPSPMGWFGKAE